MSLAAMTAVSHRQSDDDLLTALRELIDALDRRVPPQQRAGETAIADDAERLRALAVGRIAVLAGPRFGARGRAEVDNGVPFASAQRATG